MSASEAPTPPSLIAAVTELRDRAMAASTLAGLGFSIANDPYPLLRFRQALVLVPNGASSTVLCVSGLATPQEQTPYLNWLKTVTRWLDQTLEESTPRVLTRHQTTPPDDIAQGWQQWWPGVVWCVPLHDSRGERRAIALFLLDQPPPQAIQAQMTGLAFTWAYCWQALAPRRHGRKPSRRRMGWLIVGLLGLAMFLPIRQSALAPAQIISREAVVVTSPLDGIVAAMLVRPNQAVTAGTPLLRLDTTRLESQAAVLEQQLKVAEAELDAAGSLAFDDRTSLAEMTRLRGQRDQRQAELDAVKAELARTLVRAPRDGVAVYRSVDEWQGRPVTTGERILRLADPARPQMELQLAVADAIALEPGAEVTLFLTAYPLSPLHGVIEETSYQARPDDNGIAAYRLLGSIAEGAKQARLGLHGTAKVYGEDVSLGYYLIRRPLSALRAWTGW
ncbi:efflux RND transporter periplasmic adaptor subunit [Salinicola aestuarinus]|uniref:efflux RND transporter periplasmic adaptor subunit n=1 Tax=Salinicola aestuarinus TaxID=1949082 RepID=UPI000DA1E35D|nr:HlyD family efflux transporter periplasmic adaptor subunit [Salinicola aestuarinus]